MWNSYTEPQQRLELAPAACGKKASFGTQCPVRILKPTFYDRGPLDQNGFPSHVEKAFQEETEDEEKIEFTIRPAYKEDQVNRFNTHVDGRVTCCRCGDRHVVVVKSNRGDR